MKKIDLIKKHQNRFTIQTIENHINWAKTMGTSEARKYLSMKNFRLKKGGWYSTQLSNIYAIVDYKLSTAIFGDCEKWLENKEKYFLKVNNN